MAESRDNNRTIPEAVLRILQSRGIKEEDYEEFFSRTPRLAYDPFQLANMRAGVDLLLKAVDSGKRIVIYGDYDVDGITSTSLMMKVIGSLTENVSYYIPSRLDEGYGLHKESIDRIHDEGGEFILTVDCGSVSRDETEYAHSLGIETLVTDHHNVSEVRAEGLIINPRLPEDEYPFKGLAGVGVAYKLALAISREREIPKEIMSEILELVTIGTIADIMPLVSENRTIVKCGLRFMHLGCKNKGLRRLIDLSGLDYSAIRASNISFGIAPKINAAGRLGDASIEVRLFLAQNEAEIEKYCNQLIEANQERRSLQDHAYERSLDMIDSELSKGDFVMLEINDSHEGVLGIVAGKVREEINRPVVVISRNGDTYKGTGRSIPTVNLFDMLDRYRDEFISFGGHSAACGFTIAADRVQQLKEDLNRDISEMFSADHHIFDRSYDYDVEVVTSEINMDLAEAVELIEPCGKENEVPTFLIRGASVSNWRYLKNDTRFAKFQVPTEDGRWVDCLVFHDAEEFNGIVERGGKVDILGNVEINRWRDTSRVQMIVNWILPEGEL